VFGGRLDLSAIGQRDSQDNASEAYPVTTGTNGGRSIVRGIPSASCAIAGYLQLADDLQRDEQRSEFVASSAQVSVGLHLFCIEE